MKKVLIIYWSGTGNTEAMAAAIAAGAEANGTATVEVLPVEDATLAMVKAATAVAFGCPSMGNEVLEETTMEPFIQSLQTSELSGKPLALFGSYGWGDGQWMRDWEQQMTAKGGVLIADGLIIQNTPDADGLADCRKLGQKLVAQ